MTEHSMTQKVVGYVLLLIFSVSLLLTLFSFVPMWGMIIEDVQEFMAGEGKPDCGDGEHAAYVEGEGWTCMPGLLEEPEEMPWPFNTWWMGAANIIAAVGLMFAFVSIGPRLGGMAP